MRPKDLFELSDEVRKAVSGGGPVVALESSLISHGLPWPHNLQIAKKCEDLLRQQDVTPATIAILDGKAHIGLSGEQIEWLAKHPAVAKVNLSNLSVVPAAGGSGACTVSATLTLAARAGLSVMATGGIGGVHRDVARSLDISSDLKALAQESMIVVSAGAKSVLALPETLEALETLGVPVLGWRTHEFPVFYSRSSGCRLEHRVDRIEEIVEVYRAHRSLNLSAGILVANPIPAEHEIPAEELEPWIQSALSDAASQNVEGKALTPFLLNRLKQLSGERTIPANLALVENNVRLAGQIARLLRK